VDGRGCFYEKIGGVFGGDRGARENEFYCSWHRFRFPDYGN
jgi:hypothetical protein